MIYIWIVDISFNGYKVDYGSYLLGIRIIDRVCQNWKFTHETRCSYDEDDDERLGPLNDDDDNGDDGIVEEEDLGRKSRHRSSSSSDVDINIDGLCPFYSVIKPIA